MPKLIQKTGYIKSGGAGARNYMNYMSCSSDIPLTPCQQGRCAWWDEETQMCAMLVLARAAKKVSENG